MNAADKRARNLMLKPTKPCKTGFRFFEVAKKNTMGENMDGERAALVYARAWKNKK